MVRRILALATALGLIFSLSAFTPYESGSGPSGGSSGGSRSWTEWRKSFRI